MNEERGLASVFLIVVALLGCSRSNLRATPSPPAHVGETSTSSPEPPGNAARAAERTSPVEPPAARPEPQRERDIPEQAVVDTFGKAFFSAAATRDADAYNKLLPSRDEFRACTKQALQDGQSRGLDVDSEAALQSASNECWSSYEQWSANNFQWFLREAEVKGVSWPHAAYLGSIAAGLPETPNVYVYLRSGSQVLEVKLDDAIVTVRGLVMGDGIQHIKPSEWPSPRR